VAAGRRRTVEEEFRGRLRFERRTFLLAPRDGQRPAYDEYVVSHRVRAAQLAPELGFAIPRVGMPYPRSSWPAQLLAMRVNDLRHPRLAALEDQLFGAMFRELADISDPAVLRRCAVAAGVPPEDVDLAQDDAGLKERARREHAEAQEEGIDGIPGLLVPGLPPISGAVPVDLYRRALQHALSREGEDAPPEP
jgi:predicted DsbA family dithiol-disulfide isomerase